VTDLERKTAAAWDHIRQSGSAFIAQHDGLKAGFLALKKQGKITIFGRGYARLVGKYLEAFLAGEEVK
jgi:aspartokinase